MTTPAKLFGRELSSYDEVDVDELLAKLTQEELNMLAKEVDPDVSYPCYCDYVRVFRLGKDKKTCLPKSVVAYLNNNILI